MNEKWILYQTTNICNCKIYVGVHKLANNKRSKNYLGSGQALQPALNKYGRENFTRVTLAEFYCAEDAYTAEAEMVTEEFCKRNDTYNIKTGGIGGTGGGLGLIRTEEHRAKLSAANKGKIMSEETKAKISVAKKGTCPTEEYRAKMSALKMGNKNMLGKTASSETKAKMSISQKGRTHTVETKAKISNASKGNQHCLGKNHTIAAKAKMSDKHHKSMAVIINGIYYTSGNLAAKAENISQPTMRNRVKSLTSKFTNYRYATEKEKADYEQKKAVS